MTENYCMPFKPIYLIKELVNSTIIKSLTYNIIKRLGENTFFYFMVLTENSFSLLLYRTSSFVLISSFFFLL